MSTYTPPLRDMLFAMKELGGLDAVLAQPGNEEVTADLVEAILDEASKFASNVLAPINKAGRRAGLPLGRRRGDHRRRLQGRPTRASARPAGTACRRGTEFGGQGMPTLLSTAVLEMWKASNMAFSLCQMLTLGAVEAIAHHASDELKQRYLPAMVEGRWTGTMNITEPQAGSDLAAIRSKAVPEGDHYRISGTKIFITWGEHDMAENIVHLVLARLPDAPPGVKGISLFLCPKFLVNADGSLGERNDLVCASIEHKMGIHGSATAVMSFGEGAGRHRLAGRRAEPGPGLHVHDDEPRPAERRAGRRGDLGARLPAGARVRARPRAGQDAGPRRRAQRDHHRPPRRAPHADGHEGARRGDARAGLLHRRPDGPRPRPRRPRACGSSAQTLVDLLIPVVKGWCTDNALAITSDGVQIHGGMGFIEETGASQHLRDARITTIYEGTTGIQANDLIGRKLARDGGAAMKRLIATMVDDAAR